MPDFKQIHAWQRAHALGIALHKLTSGFVPVGHANLRAKLTRAADSIASTIAEGCGAATAKEFARFLEMSIKSANDTEYHLLSPRGLGLVSRKDWQKCNAETIEIRKMTFGYRKKVLENDAAKLR